jgi:outer membrane biosynthesis protein TonB
LQPSGIPAFDNGCVQAIENSAPFPPLPEDFRDEIIGITIPFKYQP